MPLVQDVCTPLRVGYLRLAQKKKMKVKRVEDNREGMRQKGETPPLNCALSY